MNKYLQCRTQVLIVHCEGVLCILLIVKLASQAESNVSLGLADIPRNLKISPWCLKLVTCLSFCLRPLCSCRAPEQCTCWTPIS